MNTLPLSAECCRPCCDPETVAVPGPPGPPATPCDPCLNGIDAFSITVDGFTMPPFGFVTPSLEVNESRWMGAGQIVYVTGAGWMRVVSKADSTHVVLRNLEDLLGNYAENADPGTPIPGLQLVSPGGLSGPASTNGNNGTNGTNGIDAFTTTLTDFVQPAEGADVTVSVVSSAWIGMGQHLFVENGGDYVVVGLASGTVTIRNLADSVSGGYPANAAPGTTIFAGVKVSPGGIQGPSNSAINAAVVEFSDVQASGDPSQTASFGSWQTLEFNTVLDPSSVVVASAGNQFQLLPGRYSVSGLLSVEQCLIRTKIQRVSDATLALRGGQLRTFPNAGGQVSINGWFDAAAGDIFEWQYWATDDGGGTLGLPMSTGDTEIYKTLQLTKLTMTPTTIGDVVATGSNYCFSGIAPNQILKLLNVTTSLYNQINSAQADPDQTTLLGDGGPC